MNFPGEAAIFGGKVPEFSTCEVCLFIRQITFANFSVCFSSAKEIVLFLCVFTMILPSEAPPELS